MSALADVGDVRARWLTYSRRVLCDADHIAQCSALGGSDASDDRLPTDIRWPGYVGSEYQPGGLLWINIVHRDMDVRGAPLRQITHLEQVAAAWAAERVGDDAYLDANRAAYVAGLGTGGWRVGVQVRKLAAALGVELSQIAYTNMARCQVVPTDAEGAERRYGQVQDTLAALCQGWLPVRELVEILRPGLIYTTATKLAPILVDLPGDPMVVVVTQRMGPTRMGWQPERGRVWASIAEEYERRRGLV